MKLYKMDSYEDLCRKGADILASQIILKPDSVLGLATGSTPIGIYKDLAERHSRGILDFSCVRTVNLDEYKNLPPDNPQSYAYYMNLHLFSKVNIKPDNTHIPNGLAADEDTECSAYEQIIRDLGGIDMQLLGIGANGHIGFCEPGDKFEKLTHVVPLAESTIDANSRFFNSPDEVPRFAYTMGIKTIMAAKRILIVAAGKAKADALNKALYGPITPRLPASILQLHRDVTVVADREAFTIDS